MKGLKFKNGAIGYRHFPKVACTSIKQEMYRVDNKVTYSESREGRHIHDYYNARLVDIDECSFKFTVVRDPIQRFLSAYSNRVTHHMEASKKHLDEVGVVSDITFPVYNPSLSQFMEFFDLYSKIPSISWHIKPYAEFIADFDIFDSIYPINEIYSLEKDLSEIIGENIKFGREQTGGKKFSVKELKSTDVDFLLDYYSKDYELLAQYFSVDDVWKKWKSPK